jgi:hypothetical protein
LRAGRKDGTPRVSFSASSGASKAIKTKKDSGAVDTRVFGEQSCVVLILNEKTVGGVPAAFIEPFNQIIKGGSDMSTRMRITDRSKGQSTEKLIAMAGAVIAGLTNNPALPAPTVDLKTVQTAADELNAALTAQAHGGRAATAEKNNKKEALIAMLRMLKHYVEDNCGNDPAVLLSSGFPSVSNMHTNSPLANPMIVSIDFGTSRELGLKIPSVARAKCYDVQFAKLDTNNTIGAWQRAGLFTSTKSIVVKDLIPGTTYVFQVRAVGGSTGYSDWSNPVSRMCT